MKTVTILRGTSSAGKSTVAEYLQNQMEEQGCVVCTADDYFVDPFTGNYNFDVEQLGQAHAFCFDKFADAVHRGIHNVIQANTNTSEWEFKKYKDLAEQNGYRVHILTVEKWHDNTNDHGVPTETIDRQERKLKASLRLR